MQTRLPFHEMKAKNKTSSLDVRKYVVAKLNIVLFIFLSLLVDANLAKLGLNTEDAKNYASLFACPMFTINGLCLHSLYVICLKNKRLKNICFHKSTSLGEFCCIVHRERLSTDGIISASTYALSHNSGLLYVSDLYTKQ